MAGLARAVVAMFASRLVVMFEGIFSRSVCGRVWERHEED